MRRVCDAGSNCLLCKTLVREVKKIIGKNETKAAIHEALHEATNETTISNNDIWDIRIYMIYVSFFSHHLQ